MINVNPGGKQRVMNGGLWNRKVHKTVISRGVPKVLRNDDSGGKYSWHEC